MNENENRYETWLRAAKPTNDEIAPLSPEASSRILSAALRANRSRRTVPFYLSAPFRVATSSMGIAAVVYCMIPFISPSELPVVNKPEVSSATKKSSDTLTARSASSKRHVLPKLPSALPTPIKPQVMVARNSLPSPATLRNGETVYASKGIREGRGADSKSRTPSDSRVEGLAVSQSSVGGRASGTVRKPSPLLGDAATDEGNMYVSVTGDSVLPPESDTDDDLTVTVERNVPDSVSGSAEAAALHAIPLPSATPDPADAQSIPVWTHVRVETGEEPVLILTALN
ncbi:MAG: hypothetical protein H8F28_16845 [Fibrella sp.]|nr:hypothetical protein [Armatimonadota bacterium]